MAELVLGSSAVQYCVVTLFSSARGTCGSTRMLKQYLQRALQTLMLGVRGRRVAKPTGKMIKGKVEELMG